MYIDDSHLWEKPDYGMEILHMPWYKALVSLQDVFVKASMEFFSREGLLYIPLPVTTGAVSSPMGLGSDSIPVQVRIKGKDIYLADSMQFFLEYACRMTEQGSFYLMPCFRGENTDERHLSQFFHSEVEIPGTLEDVMSLAERYTAFLSRRMLECCKKQILEIAGTTAHLERMAEGAKIPRVSFKEAVAMLSDHPECLELLPGGYYTINKYGEAFLLEKCHGCLWLTYFDSHVVPFYQAERNGEAQNADLLMGIGETLGAGERHLSAQEVRAAMEKHQVDPMGYEWYIQMKERYPLKTSGFGMGMERFLLWVLKHDDIRDCQIIARMDGAAMAP
jgi:asparaginyl-tRNA synthetase